MTKSHQTKGGAFGHFTRRFFHVVSLIFLLFIYYHWIIPTFSSSSLAHDLLFLMISFVVVFEALRLKFHFVFFAQRDYEATQVCAFTWGVLAACLVLLFSPNIFFSVAIITSCALVDPLLGELKHKIKKSIYLFLLGVISVILIWLICAVHYRFPIWIAFLMGPITVACEWPSLKWIDDNALMMLVPLAITLIIY